MLIDLTLPVPLLHLDGSPFAIIVRTQGKKGNLMQGSLSRHAEANGRNEILSLSAKASKDINSETCYETILPVGENGYRKMGNRKRVCRPKDKWLVSVKDLTKNQELFAVSVKDLDCSLPLKTPLERLAMNPVFKTMCHDGTVWDRLREEEI